MSSSEDIVRGRRRGGLPGLLHSAKKKLVGTRGIIVPAWKTATGEVPDVEFSEMLAVYLADYIARTAVDFQADMVAGSGFYTTIDSNDKKALEMKAFVDEWCRKVNLDGLGQVTAREVIGFGNSFWQKSSETVEVKIKDKDAVEVFGLTLIPIESMKVPRREADGTIKHFEQISSYGGGKLEVDDVLHFRWNPVGNPAGGIGILDAVCRTLRIDSGRRREPLYKAIANLHQDIIEHSASWSAPNQIIVFPEMDDAVIDEWGRKLRNAPRRGARWVTNIEGTQILQAETRRPGGWDAGLETLMDAYIIALHTPLPKLISKTGFTEASARAALEVAERMTMSLQRFFKREYEILFEAVAEVGGYTDMDAYVEVNWGPPEAIDLEVIQMLFPSITQAWLEGGIRTSEYRAILREILHLEMIAAPEEIDVELEEIKGGEPQADGEPKSDEERAKAHFGISDEDWEAMDEEERAAKIAELPESGTGRATEAKKFRVRIVRG